MTRALTYLLGALLLATGLAAADTKPNIVFILADDMGWNGTSVEVHGKRKDSKSDFYRTPNIQKLAEQGMTFSHAYAPAPMCTPSRASFLTGKSPAQLHITSPGPPQRPQSWQKIAPPMHTNVLAEKEVTIAEQLKDRGYTTAHLGKWHLHGGGPGKHGFDIHDGDTENKGPGDKDDPNPKDIFGITERAIKVMTDCVGVKKPFYLQLSHYAVHTPMKALAKTVAATEKRPKGEVHKDVTMAAMTEDLDTSIGMLLDTINKLAIADSTYVVFMSDNGGGSRRGQKVNAPLNSGKGSLWEGGIRVPLIVRGPNIKAGSHCGATVVGQDLFPTFSVWAGVKSEPKGTEGYSLVGLLSGIDKNLDRKEVVFHYPHYGRGPDQVPQSAIIAGNLKLLKFYETDTVKLFDLDTDIGESRDLAKSRPDEAKALQERLAAYLKSVNAQLPTKNENYDPKAERPNRGKKGGKRFIERLDKDGDGKVSAKEFGRPARFRTFDKNNDGFLTEDEAPEPPGRRK